MIITVYPFYCCWKIREAERLKNNLLKCKDVKIFWLLYVTNLTDLIIKNNNNLQAKNPIYQCSNIRWITILK